MQAYFKYGNLESNPQYSCVNVTLTFNELSAHHVKHPYIGVAYMTAGFFFEVAYILSLTVIWSGEFLKLSCFKLMFALGVIDCLCIILAYFYTGYWYMIGYEYCMYPYTSYWVGNLNTVVINTCFMLSMLLAFNRFLDMWKPEIGERLFKANRTWIFVFAAVLFGVFGAYYSIPAFFSTDFGTFIYHPLIPGKENLKYYTIFQPIINMFTGVSICLCYSSICIVYWMRLRHGNLQTQTDFQKRILIQAVLICFPTFTVTCMWTSFNFITPTSFLMNVAHLNWQLMHAVPAFVYLFVNKTIRRRAFVMIFACIGVTPGNSYHTNSKVDSTPSKSIELQSPNEDPHQNPRD